MPESARAAARAGPRQTICQVLHSLRTGGAEVLAARLARGLSGAYRFVFACLDEPGELGERLRAEGFVVDVLGRRPGLDWRCSLKLAALYRAEGVALVHAHQYTPFFYAVTARLARRRPPVLFTEHGRFHPDFPRPKRMAANRVLLGRGDRVVGVGEAVRQALIRNEGFAPGRVGVIYNGVDLSAFDGGGAGGRAAARRDLGLGEHDLVLFQVARLDPIKDHVTAVRAVGRVAQVRPDVRLVVVGEGPEETSIREQIRALGVDGHVRLLGLRDDVARLLPAADIVLLTSVSEGIPLTLIEAMAAAKPVVATRVGGVGEVVVEGQSALLAPAGDDAGLARAILRLAADPDLRLRMGAIGRRTAEEKFSEIRMHDGYLKVYEEMLLGKRCGPAV